jgi:hypothetical protein
MICLPSERFSIQALKAAKFQLNNFINLLIFKHFDFLY